MRHGKAFRKFGRNSSQRKALFRNLANSLFRHERVETTLAKAKDLRRVSEKLITLAKEDTVHRRRQAYGYLPNKEVVHKLFAEIGPKFKERPGGYTRVVKTRSRVGDAADMAIIELVQEAYSPSKKKPARKTKGTEGKSAEKKGAKKESAAAETSAE
ncbi:MAG: 50S ribosomal protein L17 [Bdellovibrionales bacterium]|nr:50S ribosomal protein L17 [Bdellovibrionales bacterium]